MEMSTMEMSTNKSLGRLQLKGTQKISTNSVPKLRAHYLKQQRQKWAGDN